MNDAPTLVTVAVAAIGLGAGALKLAQNIVKKDRHEKSDPKSAGRTAAEWEATIHNIDAKNIDERVMPILKELKEIALKQNEIQQKQNEILIEIVTVSRIGRRSGGS